MAFKQQDVVDEVKAHLQKDAPSPFVTSDEVIKMIGTALRTLNYDKPLILVSDITGDGTPSYDLEAVGFKKGFSDLNKVEFPADEVPPVFKFKNKDWIVYEDPSKTAGQQIRLLFLLANPTSPDVIRVTLESPYTLTTTTSDLDDTAFTALVYKATELVLRALANKFALSTDPNIAADAVDYANRSNNFQFSAEKMRAAYEHLAGLDEDVKASQAFAEADIRIAGVHEMFWHRARDR